VRVRGAEMHGLDRHSSTFIALQMFEGKKVKKRQSTPHLNTTASLGEAQEGGGRERERVCEREGGCERERGWKRG
jgi:hypothetical protein